MMQTGLIDFSFDRGTTSGSHCREARHCARSVGEKILVVSAGKTNA